MKKIFLALGACLWMLSYSCSPVPKPMSPPFTFQKKLQSVYHWELMARDIAKQTIEVLKQEHPLILQEGFGHAFENDDNAQKDYGVLRASGWERVYIPNNDTSPFGKSFCTLLKTELVKHGVGLSHTPKNAVKISWSVDKIKHEADRAPNAAPGSRSFLALLGYDVYKIWDHGSTAAGLVTAGIALDALDSFEISPIPKNVPHTEVLITFSIEKDDTILARQSNTYYINDKDSKHYSNRRDFGGQVSQLKCKKFEVVNK